MSDFELGMIAGVLLCTGLHAVFFFIRDGIVRRTH